MRGGEQESESCWSGSRPVHEEEQQQQKKEKGWRG